MGAGETDDVGYAVLRSSLTEECLHASGNLGRYFWKAFGIVWCSFSLTVRLHGINFVMVDAAWHC